ncbi:hypothetical protein A3SI_15970 [Nitritalea halalkaliphila LW7]|uniref:DUF3667 domain-containing protein n=1 Tax=Nitritalea halalkaliphila LW7 TaxID=1189621 RepID=I5BY56_9BACT|nr:DUF3667 domain-containing protein [Nitritalea halalkaliphila]EIM74508.1 hypothetical protein A3SI_15970 [Nitritalea halalkaliphila LW7]
MEKPAEDFPLYADPIPGPDEHVHCLNCGHRFAPKANFCAHCGQGNKPRRLQVGLLLSDFLEGYMNWEGKLWKTFPLLFYRPWQLTIAFLYGRRKRYIHPARLYLFTSLFYFFTVSLLVPTDVIDTAFQRADALGIQMGGGADDGEAEGVAASSTRQRYFYLRQRAIDPDVSLEAFQESLSETMSWDSSYSPIVSVEGLRRFFANSSTYVGNVLRNLPLMMFVLLPIFGLLLVLMLWRRPFFYADHIIHAFHIHAFAYLFYGLAFIYNYLGWVGSDYAAWFSFFWVSMLGFGSLKKVYRLGFWSTTWRFILLGTLYGSVLLLALGLVFWLTFRYQ